MRSKGGAWCARWRARLARSSVARSPAARSAVAASFIVVVAVVAGLLITGPLRASPGEGGPSAPASPSSAEGGPQANGPAQEEERAPARVDPAEGAAGSVLRVHGAGFAPGEEVALYWGGDEDNALGRGTADARGRVVIEAAVPPGEDAGPGAHALYLVGRDGRRSAAAEFTVLPRGEDAERPGSGAGEEEPEDDEEPEDPDAPASARPDPVPSPSPPPAPSPPGGLLDGLARLLVSPLQGAGGSPVTVEGAGFEPGERVVLSWVTFPGLFGFEDSERVATVTADGEGGFAARVRAPSQDGVLGTYAWLRAEGSDSGVRAESYFYVQVPHFGP
ncbi:hypothetical protein RM780_02785 [Streptomyces sp. DSM 44917]|uniref:IPT/TIG domain-containing protein n=1 Tax=Streptomyces boetiae TaxID=3075541 RepID=A0ABU2L2U1_9ACTN|nr:hypothetical protein [Streptomyces sp. DSM 44917]MDT0305889.1 hypothetical protein [Streptomyces sp. DSM 44917]